MTACKFPALPQIDFPPGFPPAIPSPADMIPKLPDLSFDIGISINIALPALPGFPPAFPPAIPSPADLLPPFSLDFGFDIGIDTKLSPPGLPAFPPGFPPAIPNPADLLPPLPELPTCPLDP